MTTAPAAPPSVSCSFCTKPNIEVSWVVAGPGVYICDECVALCQQVGPASRDSADLALPIWESQTNLEEVLGNLPRIAAAGAQVEVALTGWVRHARTLGATWARIGEALGMTRQSAWERFAGEE